MSKTARIYKNAPFFHIIVQGIDKEDIFIKERYKNEYKKIIEKELENTPTILEIYCIMDNHAHFILKNNNIKELSVLMQKVNSAYAHYYNYMENGRVGYVFRDRFLSEPISNKQYLINCIKYIHNNPVKAGMVKHCAEYKFSSYGEFLNILNTDKGDILNVLTKNEILDICYNTETNKVCMDIDNNNQDIIVSGIIDFVDKEQIQLFKIFENRDMLIELIKYLKNVNKIKYIDIMKYLEVERGTMEGILKKIRSNKKQNKTC